MMMIFTIGIEDIVLLFGLALFLFGIFLNIFINIIKIFKRKRENVIDNWSEKDKE